MKANMEGMFSRFKSRVMNVINLDIPVTPIHNSSASLSASASNTNFLSESSINGRFVDKTLPNKFAYNRPGFLQLATQDELRASADHNIRPIIVPRDIDVMPWNTGYAECVNSGKSEWNEDQSAFYRHILTHPNSKHDSGLPYTYFGVFDGHAGYGAALAASHQFHHILHEKLVDIIDLLWEFPIGDRKNIIDSIPHPISFHRNISKDELIIGALEAAFLDMDALLAEDRSKYRNAGGCTALVALFISGKMFVSNAGDSRAVLCHQMENLDAENAASKVRVQSVDGPEKEFQAFPVPFSFDHTPETERNRLMTVAQLNPILLAGEYIGIEYAKRPLQRDLGKRVLYRQGTMKGWAYKTLTTDDLKMPIVTGEGKRSRLLGTIGVTRGFGDHDLRALCSGVLIKPFLSPQPEVVYRDLSKVVSTNSNENSDGEYGILVMATDGLWDVIDTETVSKIVFRTLKKFPTENHRYTMVAQELVAKARGKINESGHWRLVESKAAATVDDISVIVIPVHKYYKEYLQWHNKYVLNEQVTKEEKAQTDEFPATELNERGERAERVTASIE